MTPPALDVERADSGARTPGQTGRALLRTLGIVKDFTGLRALDDVDFDLAAGEVHVLFGENGAGKSTLINVISGAAGNWISKIFYKFGKRINFDRS